MYAAATSDVDFEFDTYMGFWMASLFVVVEGFNKLKLQDKRVQRLFLPHLGKLKAMRHEMFHFQMGAEGSEAIRSWNWVCELHDALEEHCKEYIAESVVRYRKAKQRKGRKRGRHAKA